jgi:hypothetical protein
MVNEMVTDDRSDAMNGETRGPELTAEQLEEMLAELDAICRQARELSTQIALQMSEQRRRDQLVSRTLRFPRRV